MGQYGNGVSHKFDPTKLKAATPTYLAVGEIYTVDFGGITADVIDDTVHGDSWRTFVAGLKNAGTVTIGIRFGTEEAQHKSLLDSVGVACAHKFEWPLNTSSNTIPFSIEVDAIIQTATLAGPHDGLLDMQVTLQISGQPTITAEAAL